MYPEYSVKPNSYTLPKDFRSMQLEETTVIQANPQSSPDLVCGQCYMVSAWYVVSAILAHACCNFLITNWPQFFMCLS